MPNYCRAEPVQIWRQERRIIKIGLELRFALQVSIPNEMKR
jgi:hypothetical protein